MGREWNTPWENGYLSVGGVRLHYVDWGSAGAPPLLFLHGLSSHAHTFDPFAPLFLPRFHLLALDQRGHGESDWSPEGYDGERFVADLEAFVEALGLNRLTLIGHSMGARNAWNFAARRPERMERLVLVDLGPEIERQGMERMRSSPAPESFASRDEAFRFMRQANPRPSDDMLILRLLHNLKRGPDGRWVWRYDPALRDPQRARRAATDGEEAWAALARIPCPTLVVRGAESDLLSQEVAERMALVLPQGRLVVIPGAGHTVPADRPREFAAALAEFLGLGRGQGA